MEFNRDWFTFSRSGNKTTSHAGFRITYVRYIKLFSQQSWGSVTTDPMQDLLERLLLKHYSSTVTVSKNTHSRTRTHDTIMCTHTSVWRTKNSIWKLRMNSLNWNLKINKLHIDPGNQSCHNSKTCENDCKNFCKFFGLGLIILRRHFFIVRHWFLAQILMKHAVNQCK